MVIKAPTLRAAMTNLTAEEVQEMIQFTDELLERAESDPALVKSLLASLHERPKAHPLTPKERGDKLLREYQEELGHKGNGSESR